MTTGEDTHGRDYFTSLFLLPQLCNSTENGPVLPLVEVEAEVEDAKGRELFGDDGPTLQTPLGTAVLFQLAIADPVRNKVALERLVYNSKDWGDFTEAQFITPMGFAEHVMESTDDPSIKHVKLIPLAGSRSVVAFAAA